MTKKYKQPYQHKKSFYNTELNVPNQNITTPFRIMDSIWLVGGKYKGHKLDTIPVEYLNWVLENFNHLSKTHKALIQQEINKRVI